MDITIGLDPGGAGQFGWAVLECATQSIPVLRAAGTSSHAHAAVANALSHVGADDQLRGAGIDSPLYWTSTGRRAADVIVREAIKRCGARNVGGTVQHPNALRGACVVQGPTAALLLRQRFPELAITEAHPKALLWLLGIATRDRQPVNLTRRDLAPIVNCSFRCEHERDAVLAAVSAHAMRSGQSGWRDLVALEDQPIFIAGIAEYWLPIT